MHDVDYNAYTIPGKNDQQMTNLKQPMLMQYCLPVSPPGGDVNAQASNGDSVLYDAAGSGNLDCIELLLQNGANPNIASYACQLPIHRAAYEGHFL